MNIESNKSTSAAAILSSSEMNSSLAVQNRKNTQSSSSFQEQLKKSSNEENSSVKEKDSTEAQETNETQKASEVKASDKANKKEVSNSAKEKNSETKKSEQNSQTVQDNNHLHGEIVVNTDFNEEAYSMLSDQVKNFMLQNGGQFNLNNINLMMANTRAEIANVQPKIDYNSVQMSDNDALFFANLVKNTDMTMQSVASEFQKALEGGQVQQAQSSAKASAALIAALQESSKTNQPFRIDFDKDVSVILQVDKDGKINANFIPGDKAVEAYLRNNIDFLRQRFNEENIAYGDLNYSKSRQGKDERQQRNKKEQDNE